MAGGGERTEEATPKHRADARRKGQVHRSAELSTAVTLLGGAWLLKETLPGMLDALLSLLRQTFEAAPTVDMTELAVQHQAGTIMWLYAGLVGPMLLGLCALGIVSHVGQVGFIFSGEQLSFQFSRINPLAGAKRLLSGQALVETIKALVKLLVIGYVAWGAMRDESHQLSLLALMPPRAAASTLAGIVMSVIWRTAGAWVIIAGADYAYGRWAFTRSLRMTREEVKQEFKETEGNPEIKARLRQRARAFVRRRMMQDVPKADVVLTNPTHYAVALRYEPGMAAPRVLARGAGFIAQQIKDTARAHGVPVMENKPLAQALYKACDVGQLVPPELYKAVAEVLAFVYRLRAPRPRTSRVAG
jgi:flagellar biosynthetic protein FlhB